MKVLLFIGRLGGGGAERQLALLATGLAARGHEVEVLTLYPGGHHWRALEEEGRVGLDSLFPRRAPTPLLAALQRLRAVARLRGRLLARPPSVLYSFLYVANALAASALASSALGGVRLRAAGAPARVPLVWGLRASNPRLGLKELPALWWSRHRSPGVDLVIANSQAGVEYHRRRGFQPPRFAVVGNGIDTELFHPDAEVRTETRRRWGLGDRALAVGQVARLHPMKDHSTLLRAAALVLDRLPDLRLVFAGGGSPRAEARLRRLAARLGLGDRVLWLGEKDDVAAVYNGLDVLVSASAYGEGFPNAVGEAMACGVPCAVTDVGDSARVVGDLAPVVPPGRPEALARALVELAQLGPEGRRERGAAGRRRVIESFSVESSVTATERLLDEVVAARGRVAETPS